jgi:peptidyl-prolyl cis-trans isomerase B (cyclophilin B)
MANTGQPDTAGSQFFIVYKNSPSLINQTSGPQYTILGKVSKGLNVVQTVAAKGSNPAGDGKPKLPISLTSVVAAGSSSTPPSASASSSPAG